MLQLISIAYLQRMGMEMDIGWEFESSTHEGWGNATSEVFLYTFCIYVCMCVYVYVYVHVFAYVCSIRTFCLILLHTA